jgi:hypothetical protein
LLVDHYAKVSFWKVVFLSTSSERRVRVLHNLYLPRLLLVIKDSGKYVNPERDEKTPYSRNLVSYVQDRRKKTTLDASLSFLFMLWIRLLISAKVVALHYHAQLI